MAVRRVQETRPALIHASHDADEDLQAVAHLGRLAVEIADMDARITYLEEQAEQERDKAVAFCSTIQDARLYLIFRLRFVRCLTWAEVADLLGDYYTEEGVCRMAYNYLAKTEKEKPTAQSA